MNPTKAIKKIIIPLYIRFKGRPSQLKKAIRLADRLHKKDGRRYRVFFFGYSYRVWNRQDIKDRKHSKLFKRHLKVGHDFDSVAFYDTLKKGA